MKESQDTLANIIVAIMHISIILFIGLISYYLNEDTVKYCGEEALNHRRINDNEVECYKYICSFNSKEGQVCERYYWKKIIPKSE